MSERSIVLIDAGYLVAAAATMITGSQYRRGVNVHHARLVAGVRDIAAVDGGRPVQRVIWYDAAPGGQPTPEHRRIGHLEGVKIRIGRVGVSGEQKGVDVRLALDLIDAAATGRIATVYLVTGDDDLSEAVDRVQALGVEVVLLVVPTATGDGVTAVADNLMLTADRTQALPAGLLDHSIVPVTTTAPPRPATASTGSVVDLRGDDTATTTAPDPEAVAYPRPVPHPPLAATPKTDPPRPVVVEDQVWVRSCVDAVADHLAATLSRSASAEELRRIQEARPSIPADVDRVLLHDTALGLRVETVPEHVRRDVRGAFWDALDEVASGQSQGS